MSHFSHSAVAILGLTAALAAQNTFTSPAGLEAIDGDGNHDYILFSSYAMRWQQVDHSQVGTPRVNINAISFRRDHATVSDSSWTARNLTNVFVYMGHSNRGTFCADPHNLDNNLSAPPVLVYFAQNVSLPDWTQQTAVNPEPWTITWPFVTGFNYNGVEDLVWEVRYDTNDNTTGDYGNDYQGPATNGQATNSGTIIGTGCTATGETSAFDLLGTWAALWNGTYRLNFRGTDAPVNSPAIVYLGLSNPNLVLPGLCGTIYTDAALGSLPIGVSDASGTIANINYCVPAGVSISGAQINGQALALDVGQPGLPIALTYGRLWTVPTAPAIATPVATRFYTYRTSSTSTTTSYSGPWYGGIVAGFTY